MEEQAKYVTKEPRFTQSEVLNALVDVIARKNLNKGINEMLQHDHLAIQMTNDAFKNLKSHLES
jgi:hypothetical protein